MFRALRDVATGELVTPADVCPDYVNDRTIPGETTDDEQLPDVPSRARHVGLRRGTASA